MCYCRSNLGPFKRALNDTYGELRVRGPAFSMEADEGYARAVAKNPIVIIPVSKCLFYVLELVIVKQRVDINSHIRALGP